MRRFVVIEGLIGVGKTTLCRLLERERAAKLILEPHEDNPFLESFYNDPKRYALPVQMYYFLTRWRQQDRIRQLSLFSEWVVSDYLFQKDRMFAEMTLSDDELELYDRFAVSLGAQIPSPDLVVALHSPIDVLLGRIRKRGVPGEERIEEAYLRDLDRRYDTMWTQWDACPVLHIDNRELDYASDPESQAEVLRRIDDALRGLELSPTPGSESDREEQPALFEPRG